MIPGWWLLIAGFGLVTGIVTACKFPHVRLIGTLIGSGATFVDWEQRA